MTKSKERSKTADTAIEFDESEFETQGFEVREDDSDQLWDVETVLNEKNGGRYLLVRWIGLDANGKPWEDSWVPREDVTDDLVQEWKRKKAEKKAHKARQRKEQRETKAKASKAKSVPAKKGSTSNGRGTSQERRSHGREGSMSTVAPSDPASTRRRKRSETNGVTSEQELSVAPRKKRRLLDRESVASTNEAQSDIYDLIPSPPRRHMNGRRIATSSTNGRSSSPVSILSPDARQKATSLKRNGMEEGEEEEEEEGDKKKKGKAPRNPKQMEEEEEEEEDREVNSILPTHSKRHHANGPSASKAKGTNVSLSRHEMGNHGMSKPTAAAPAIRSRTPSVELEDPPLLDHADISSISPSKWRDGGLVSRMKAKGKGSAASSTAPTPVKNRDAWPRADSPQLEDRQMRHRQSSPNPTKVSTMFREEEPVDFSFMPDAGDVGMVLESDNFDSADRKRENANSGPSEELAQDDASPITSYGLQNKAPAKSLHKEIKEIGPSEEVLTLSASLVIPATQSQSQDRSLSQCEEAGEPDSLVVEHGSSAPQQENHGISNGDAPHPVVEEIESFHDTTVSSPPPPPSNGATSGRQLGPIPKVTPSKFRPHLPLLKRLSSLPRLDLGPREPPSSIDNTSPVKKARSTTPAKDRRGFARDDILEDIDDFEDSMPSSIDLRQRGLELHEQHRQKAENLRKGQALLRVPVSTIISSRSQSQARERASEALLPNGAGEHPPAPVQPDLLPIDDITSLAEQALQEQEAMIRQFEQEYIDFDGNAGASATQNSLLASPEQNNPKEEEEVRALTQESDDEEITGPSPPQAPLAIDEENTDDEDPFLADYASRQHTPTTTTSQQAVEVAGFRILGSSRADFNSIVETPVKQLNSALALLNHKSEEIASLKTIIAENEKARLTLIERIASLEAENVLLKKASEDHPLTSDTDAASAEKLKALSEVNEESIKERDGLLTEVSLLKSARDDADKDASLFRELYSKASSFADETRKENVVLVERTSLLESQLKNGLRLVRSQSEAQVAKLTEELERSQLQLKVLKDKDARTDDEIRRCAAREAELQPRIAELVEEISEMKKDLSAVVRNRNQLLVRNKEVEEDLEKAQSEATVLREENLGLRIEVARYSARERLTIKTFKQTSNGLEDEDTDSRASSDSEEVYICSWANDGDGNRCGKYFPSKQDLQDHLFLDGHL